MNSSRRSGIGNWRFKVSMLSIAVASAKWQRVKECETSWIRASFSAYLAYSFCLSVSAIIIAASWASISFELWVSWFWSEATRSAFCFISPSRSPTIFCKAPLSRRSTMSGSLGWVVDNELRMIGKNKGILWKQINNEESTWDQNNFAKNLLLLLS